MMNKNETTNSMKAVRMSLVEMTCLPYETDLRLNDCLNEPPVFFFAFLIEEICCSLLIFSFSS